MQKFFRSQNQLHFQLLTRLIHHYYLQLYHQNNCLRYHQHLYTSTSIFLSISASTSLSKNQPTLSSTFTSTSYLISLLILMTLTSPPTYNSTPPLSPLNTSPQTYLSIRALIPITKFYRTLTSNQLHVQLIIQLIHHHYLQLNHQHLY